jgi:hypothetical protein
MKATAPLKVRRSCAAPPPRPARAAAMRQEQPGNQAMLRRLHASSSSALSGLSLGAAPVAPQSAAPNTPADIAAPQPAPQPVTPKDAPAQTNGSADCPVTAVFVSTLAGPEKAGCQIPAGAFGSSRLTRWRLMGDLPAGSATITEQFTPIEDPYNLIGAIQKGTYTTSNGLFDDCYSLAAKKALPPDFVLKVEQNHLLNGKIISKNEITFEAGGVRFCSHHRLRGSCDFSARCSLA